MAGIGMAWLKSNPDRYRSHLKIKALKSIPYLLLLHPAPSGPVVDPRQGSIAANTLSFSVEPLLHGVTLRPCHVLNLTPSFCSSVDQLCGFSKPVWRLLMRPPRLPLHACCHLRGLGATHKTGFSPPAHLWPA